MGSQRRPFQFVCGDLCLRVISPIRMRFAAALISATLLVTIVPAFSATSELPKWLEDRRKSQLNDAKQIRAFHDFQFTDRWSESQIGFQHHAVEDANKHY